MGIQASGLRVNALAMPSNNARTVKAAAVHQAAAHAPLNRDAVHLAPAKQSANYHFETVAAPSIKGDIATAAPHTSYTKWDHARLPESQKHQLDPHTLSLAYTSRKGKTVFAGGDHAAMQKAAAHNEKFQLVSAKTPGMKFWARELRSTK